MKPRASAVNVVAPTPVRGRYFGHAIRGLVAYPHHDAKWGTIGGGGGAGGGTPAKSLIQMLHQRSDWGCSLPIEFAPIDRATGAHIHLRDAGRDLALTLWLCCMVWRAGEAQAHCEALAMRPGASLPIAVTNGQFQTPWAR